MIKGVSRIRRLGVYDDYSKPVGTKDFGIKNLIYGWNYSGKTTLSRIFAQLETKTENPDLSGCSFTLETEEQPITEANFQQSDLTVRVFNSDFIRENLNFTGASFNPILLLGRETEHAQAKLDHCDDLIKRTDEKIREIDREKSGIESAFSKAKTAAAHHIKTTLSLVETYTAAHLRADMVKVSAQKESQLLSSDVLRDMLKLSLTQDSERPDSIGHLEKIGSLASLHEQAVAILSATPTLTSTIKYLEDNPLVEKWVDAGLSLHAEKDVCEFCGGDVSAQRLEQLRAHFSKDLADHKEKIINLYRLVTAAKISINLPRKSEFSPQLRTRYGEASKEFPKLVRDFNKTVDTLAEEIKAKMDAPFKPKVPTTLPNEVEENILKAVDAINLIIDENNKVASDFENAKKQAIQLVKLHYVQEFINDQQKIGREKRLKRLNKNRARFSRFSRALSIESERLRAVISQAQLGREEINRRLSSMLGGEAVQIKVVPDKGQDRFQLVRKSGKPAKNLSDGEKTAIAFSYFLTKLKELKEGEFDEAIVYIDDPISSLDANHIFQVTAAIREFFFHQVRNGGKVEWKTKCKQIFISTHNFEFFNLLRELKPDTPSKAPMYLVKRVGPESSTLQNMPESLAKYASEYHFLFDVIHRFHNSPNKTDHETLMLLPNAVRRFVELYTYSRLPGISKQTVDQRAEKLFGVEKAKRILKVFHYFSHANTIDRLAGNNELIFDVEHAVKDLLNAIRDEDALHWDALTQAVDV